MRKLKTISVATTCLVLLAGIASPNIGQAKSTESKAKDRIDEAAEALKKGVDELGNDFDKIQHYLNNYHWKGLIQDKATSGPITLKHLELNDHSKSIIAHPGEKIEAEVKCIFNADHTSVFDLYRVVIGLKGEGPQAIIGSQSGISSGKSREKFTLLAPYTPGVYEIRFRPVDALLKSTAMDGWRDEKGQEPDATTTIGVIIVK